jgi:hypothetical protein
VLLSLLGPDSPELLATGPLAALPLLLWLPFPPALTAAASAASAATSVLESAMSALIK